MQMTKTKKPQIEVDADTWAESGSTAGMFGTAWREKRLTILPSTLDGEKIYRINSVDQNQ